MQEYNRYVAVATTFLITMVVMLFAFGYYTAALQEAFSFSWLSLIVKFFIAVGSLIIIFFGRPRSRFHRIFLGVVATTALCFGAYGAFTSSLLFGDALIFIVGTIAIVVETIEEGSARTSHRTGRALSSGPKTQS